MFGPWELSLRMGWPVTPRSLGERWLKGLKQGLCNPEGRDGEGDGREGTYVYLWLIHVDVWQKPTQFL